MTNKEVIEILTEAKDSYKDIPKFKDAFDIAINRMSLQEYDVERMVYDSCLEGRAQALKFLRSAIDYEFNGCMNTDVVLIVDMIDRMTGAN